MDSRIHELQQRLKKRRNQEQNQNLSKKPTPPSGFNNGSGNTNIATVEPFQHHPNDVVKDDSFTKSNGFNKHDPKYQSIPSNVKFIPSGKDGQKPIEMNNNSQHIEDYPLPTIIPGSSNNSVNLRLSSSGNKSNHDSSNKTVSGYSKPSVDSVSNVGINKNGPKQGPPPVALKPQSLNSKNNQNQHLQNQHSYVQQQLQHNQHLKQHNQHLPQQQNQHMQNQQQQHIQHLAQKNLQNQSGKSQAMQGHSDSVNNNSSSTQPSSAHPIISINEEERQAGSGQSSPASSEGSDSSGGIQKVADKDHEVFVVKSE